MADPNTKVQQVITALEKMIGLLDRDIKGYQDVDIEANVLGDDDAKAIQAKAKNSLAKQVKNIDKLIMDNPEIKELVGSLDENADVQALNTAISNVLAKVAEVKALEIKDADGKDVSFETKTGNVVAEIGKFKTREYIKTGVPDKVEDIDAKIEELEKSVGDEGVYKKYLEASAKLAKSTPPKTVRDEYDEFAVALYDKIGEYEQYEKAKKIDTESLRRIGATKNKYFLINNKNNKTAFKNLIAALKAIDGTQEVTIGGKTKQIEKLKLEDFTSVSANFEEVKAAVIKMCDMCDAAKGKTDSKVTEMTDILKNSVSMEVFAEDKARIEAVLSTKPFDVNKMNEILEDMTSSKGKTLAILEKLEKVNPNEVSRIQNEIKRLQDLRTKIVEEQTAEADKTAATKTDEEIDAEINAKISEAGVEDIEAQEIDPKIAVFGKDLTFKKPDELAAKRFVDLDENEVEQVLNQTYGKMNPKRIKAYERKIAEDYKGIVPIQIPILSKIVAIFRKDGLTKREAFMQTMIKNEMRKQFTETQMSSREAAEREKIGMGAEISGRVKQEISDRQTQATEKATAATTARQSAFALDEETRKKVNAAAREAARQSLLRGENADDAEKAFNAAGEKAEQGEDRE